MWRLICWTKQINNMATDLLFFAIFQNQRNPCNSQFWVGLQIYAPLYWWVSGQVWLYDICWFDHPVYQNEWFWKLKVKITLMNRHHSHHKKIRLVLMWHWNLISVEMIIFPIYTGWEQIPTHLQCGGGEQDQQSNTSRREDEVPVCSRTKCLFIVLKMCWIVHCT